MANPHTIAVAGKGGVGKTTTCGMLIDYLCKKKNGPVLVVDADANSNLNEVLGVEVETSLGAIREEMAQAELKGSIPAGMTKADYADFKFNSAIVEEDDFDMLVMGRTQGKGCYCYVNGVLKTQVDKYAKNYSYIVMDNEAGLEHVARGTLPHVDTMLLISDCSRRGIQAVARIAEMVQEMNLNPAQMGLIVNRAPGGVLDDGIKAEIEKRNGPSPAIDIPEIPRKAYGEAAFVASESLVSLLGKREAVRNVCPMSMERLGQNYGYTLYRTTLTNEETLRKIQLVSANDRAVVMLDGQIIATLYDHDLQQATHFKPAIPVRKGAVLEILMENMGRVNYSFKLEHQRKGIDSGVVINDHQKFYWEMVTCDEKVMASFQPEGAVPTSVPAAHQYAFTVDSKADTWLALPGWGKGTVILNGFCLGRFWEIGPQKRLYIPAPLLREGENTLIIVETEGKTGQVFLQDEPDLG